MARKSSGIPPTHRPSEVDVPTQSRAAATHEKTMGVVMSAAKANEQDRTPWLPDHQQRTAVQKSDGLGKMARGMVSQRESTPPVMPDKQRKAPGAR